MHNTLVNLSLRLILKVRVHDMPERSRNAKGYLISQNFRGTRRDYKNKNPLVNCLIIYMLTGLLFPTEDTKKRQSASASTK